MLCSEASKPGKAGLLISGLLLLSAAVPVLADGLVIDKIYHPYVDALESELEIRSVIQDPQSGLSNKAQVHQFSIGRALNDNVFAELNMVGGKDRNHGYETEALELELKWQLSEPGEYWADYGMVFEYEDSTQLDVQELAAGFLAEKEFAKWSATTNLFLIREWGDDIKTEFETAFGFQARYRYKPEFEPGFEIYAGENTSAIGPVLQGAFATGIRKRIHWEAGFLFGVDSQSPAKTWRFLMEYEF